MTFCKPSAVPVTHPFNSLISENDRTHRSGPGAILECWAELSLNFGLKIYLTLQAAAAVRIANMIVKDDRFSRFRLRLRQAG